MLYEGFDPLGIGSSAKKVLEDAKPILVHGYFIYVCRHCGAAYRMWVEQGLEDHGEKHKPVPFMINCVKCNDFANDVYMRIFDDGNLIALPEGANYFSNRKKSDCGIPVVHKPDGKNIYEVKRKIYAEMVR